MALDRDIERLARVPLFAIMELDALRLLAFAAETKGYRAGDVLFRRGEGGEGAMLVLSGAVVLDAASSGPSSAQVMGPGTLLAEQALLAPMHHPATAIAREPCAVLRIPRDLFMRVLHEYPANAVLVRRYWAQRLGRKLAAVKDAVRQ